MVNVYTVERKQAIIAQVLAGTTVVGAAATTGVHERTIRKWMATAAAGQPLTPARPDPKPFFPRDAQRHIYDWVVGRQLVEHPVGRSVVIPKAQEIALLGCGESAREGWYKCFKERHPALTARSAQSLSFKRNCIVPADLTTLFNTLAKLVIELKRGPSRVFNMDETVSQKQLKSKTVVAVRGSSNVWCTEPTVNFHLTVVACASASDFVVPPAFILPSKTVSCQLLEGCEVPGAAVTTSASGFIYTDLFKEWLHFFATSVPSTVQRPLVRVLDGCGSHYSEKVVDTAAHLSILLVFMPANATHLLQPLDVAVFASLKSKIHNIISDLIEEDDNGYCNIDKDDAIKIASVAWRGAKVGRNIQRGFQACGLFPLSQVKMSARLDCFALNGDQRGVHLAAYLQIISVVEEEVLKLPQPPRKNLGKKTRSVTVASGR